MPYLPFPGNWPVYTPKDKIGEWLEMYTKVMELNYGAQPNCKKASYDEKASEGTVVVERDGKEITLKPKQLILATGMSGKANILNCRMAIFEGDQHHSSRHPGPAKPKRNKAVVIGSNNSAHDICAAIWEAGADSEEGAALDGSSPISATSDALMEHEHQPRSIFFFFFFFFF